MPMKLVLEAQANPRTGGSSRGISEGIIQYSVSLGGADFSSNKLRRSMSVVDEWSERVISAIIAPVIGVISIIGGQISEIAYSTTEEVPQSAEISIGFLYWLITSLPGLMTLFGIIVASATGGLFGLFGAGLEIAGANQLFAGQSQKGIWTIFFGAGLVVLGSFIPWFEVLSELFNGGSDL